MQPFAGQIDRQRHMGAVGVRMQAYRGPRQLHTRSRAGVVAQAVAHRILQPQGTEMAVRDRRVRPGELAGDGARRVDVRAPVDRPHASVEIIRTRRLELGELQQHATCGSRPQAGAISGLERAAEQYPGAALTRVLRPDRLQLARQQVGQATRHRGNERMLGRTQARSIQVVLSSVYLSNACSDLSRPKPDCL